MHTPLRYVRIRWRAAASKPVWTEMSALAGGPVAMGSLSLAARINAHGRLHGCRGQADSRGKGI